jgi:enamine deaminase RidA (YjgF/YER057c/UK114 family)
MSHEQLNPETLSAAVGFSHAVVATPGRMVFLAGQIGEGPDGVLVSDELAAQFDAACGNVMTALEAVGGRAEDLVSVQIFVTDAAAYRAKLKPIGGAWRRHFGKHYPAMGLFEISGLLDPGALVEVMATAVIPEPGPR